MKDQARILLYDNFDSFTYNLADYFRQQGCKVDVHRNTTPPEELADMEFDLLVLSPGPCLPRDSGYLMRVIERFYLEKPIFGVCLGHQALIEFFGGTLANVAPVHGKASRITHDGKGVFQDLEQDAEVARYHSWAGEVVPPAFEVSARAADGVIMGARHRSLPLEGVQFHPESVLSMKNDFGLRLIGNAVKNLAFRPHSSLQTP